MKIAIYYFSGTNNTTTISGRIKEKLIEMGIEVEEHNLANLSERNTNIPLNQFDGVILGSPVYAWRVPRIIREWISTLNGNGIKAALFLTYGGVNVGAAHSETISLLDKQGFNVLITSEFLGKHTFCNAGWDLMLQRPNANDFQIAEQFAELIVKKFNEENPENLILEPFKMSQRQLDRMEKTIKIAVKTPSRNGEECSMCRTCETLCPTGAMNADSGEPDEDLCIRCLRCLTNCPDNVITIADMSDHQDFILKSNKITNEILDTRVSKIIQ